MNKKFQIAQGRPYLGSRDIDLGFHLEKNATAEQMKISQIAKSLQIMQDKLKFKSVSFRLVKEIHTETEEEIGENKSIPAHFIFPMYVDVIVDNIPKDFKSVFGFQPVDEPLLQFVFDKKKYRTELHEFNRKIWMPTVDVLIATKIHALQLRDKEHKKIKDICDIFALLWYSKEKPRELQQKVTQFLPSKNASKIISTIDEVGYQKASFQLNHTPQEIKRIIELLE